MTGDPNSRIWHSFTEHALRSEFPTAVRADGAYLTTERRERIIDALSSWWVIALGHRHARDLQSTSQSRRFESAQGTPSAATGRPSDASS